MYCYFKHKNTIAHNTNISTTALWEVLHQHFITHVMWPPIVLDLNPHNY